MNKLFRIDYTKTSNILNFIISIEICLINGNMFKGVFLVISNVVRDFLSLFNQYESIYEKGRGKRCTYLWKCIQVVIGENV